MIVLRISKRPDREINYGTGNDVSEESIEDGKTPIKVRWYNDSYVEIPVWTGTAARHKGATGDGPAAGTTGDGPPAGPQAMDGPRAALIRPRRIALYGIGKVPDPGLARVVDVAISELQESRWRGARGW